MAFDSLSCCRGSRLISAVVVLIVALMFHAGAVTPAQAQAASEECVELGKVMQRQGELTQAAQGIGKKKMTPALVQQACATFGKLSTNTTEAIAKLEKDGAWCHAPPTIIDALKASVPNINKAQKDSCAAVANLKKMEKQAKQQQLQQQQQLKGAGPIGGGGDVLGGPIKVPQGAL